MYLWGKCVCVCDRYSHQHLQAKVKKELKAWTKEFEKANKRSPSAEDKQSVGERFLLLNKVR
jgi:hypothetical protein